MNHEHAAQIGAGPSVGKWHYVCSHQTGTYAIGNCSKWTTCDECVGRPFGSSCAKCNGSKTMLHPHPCPGHDTAEQACAHQREYVLSTADFVPDDPKATKLEHCLICGTWTSGYAVYGQGRIFRHSLCFAHCNKESLDKLAPAVGEAWTS